MARGAWGARRRDETGGVLAMVAVMVSVLLVMAALAVDLGMQRVARRDMQAVADIVALDVARLLDGRTAAVVAAGDARHAPLATALADSVGRNDDLALGDPPVVTATLVRLDAAGDPVVGADGRPTPVTGSALPDAVLVRASTAVDFGFAPGEGGASRTALGIARKVACYSVGSYAARVRSADSALVATLVAPLNGLVRPQANLDVLGYRGLATTTVTLAELAADLTAGSVQQLLTGTVTADQLLRATVRVLQRRSPANTVAVDALGQVLKGQALLTTPVVLTDVLGVSPTDVAAAQVGLNVLDLVVGTLLVADGEHFVDLGNLSAGIGNLAPIGAARLTLVERPRLECGTFGDATSLAETSQLDADAHLRLQLPSINGITGATGVVQTPEADVRLQVDLGNATGTLAAEPVCNDGTVASPDEVEVAVRSGLATLRLSTMLRFEAKLKVNLLGVLGLTAVDVRFALPAVAEQPMPDTGSTASLRVPPHDTTVVTTGTVAPLGGFSVATVASEMTAYVAGVKVVDPSTLGLIDAALAPVTTQLAVNASVTGPLNALVSSVNGVLVPLRTLLGLNVSGADVLAVGRPVCGAPTLIG